MATLKDQGRDGVLIVVDRMLTYFQTVPQVAKTLQQALDNWDVVGSGTVSNRQGSPCGTTVANGGGGYGCIAKVRMYEVIEFGKPITPFMKFGDQIRIEMFDHEGASIFRAIDQTVQRYRASPSGARQSQFFIGAKPQLQVREIKWQICLTIQWA